MENIKEFGEKMNHLISVIVPVYKVENFLDRCVKSIVNQTYKNLEIILVDDGSPDKCGILCDLWAQKDARIRVIHKENAGLGYARNSGLDVATGEYVAFVDSDDYIQPDTYQKALERLESEKADICYFRALHDYNGKKVIKKADALPAAYSDGEVIDDFLANSISSMTDSYHLGTASWCILYTRSILEKYSIRFLSERDYLCEDLLFRVNLCKHITNIAVLPEPLYCYCHNGVSLTTSYRADRFDAAIRLYGKLMEETTELSSPDIERRCAESFMTNLIVCLKQEVGYSGKIGRKVAKENIERICSNEIVQKVVSKYPIDTLPKAKRTLINNLLNRRVNRIIFLVKMKEIQRKLQKQRV